MAIVRWGRAVSRDADIAGGRDPAIGGVIASGHLETQAGRRAVISGTIASGAIFPGSVASGAIQSGNIASGAVQVGNLFEAGGSASAEGLTATVYHNLGVTPTRVVLTQLSSAYLGTLHEGLVNNSALVVGTTVSGSYFRWWVLGG